MKVLRFYGSCGPVIELTPEELRCAYKEQQHEYDKQDILNHIEDYMSDEDDDKPFIEYLQANLDDVANEKRRNIDKYDNTWQTAIEEAITTYRYKWLDTLPRES